MTAHDSILAPVLRDFGKVFGRGKSHVCPQCQGERGFVVGEQPDYENGGKRGGEWKSCDACEGRGEFTLKRTFPQWLRSNKPDDDDEGTVQDFIDWYLDEFADSADMRYAIKHDADSMKEIFGRYAAMTDSVMVEVLKPNHPQHSEAASASSPAHAVEG